VTSYELTDAAARSICRVHSYGELLALIRALRRLDPDISEEIYRVVIGGEAYRLGGVLR
jgi:hypothetical protein